MEDIRLGVYNYCNFCYTNKPTIGVTWKRGGNDKYYHVCDKCCEVFYRRGLNRSSDMWYADAYGKEREDAVSMYYAKRSMVSSLLSNDDEETDAIQIAYEEHINACTIEEETTMAAYVAEIHRLRIKNKKEKGKQTYVRNRFGDEDFENKLIKDGAVVTQHYGIIYFSDILAMNSWTENELEIINRIARVRGKNELGVDRLKVTTKDAIQLEEINRQEVEKEISVNL